ncbi:hypothetical protein AB0467_34615 [Streptomyces sp. NPDC052095]|uniref:hypothetical protein n=1 Tax=unclassified Streptomyces TaxID=2593676 RepID=UPI00344C0F6E
MAMRLVKMAYQVLMVGLTVLFVVTMGAIAIIGHLFWDDDKPAAAPTARPAFAETAVPLIWFAIQQCADGQGSLTAEPGACAGHGGTIITLYHSNLGSLETRCSYPFHPATLERARSLLASDGTVDCDFGQTPTAAAS